MIALQVSDFHLDGTPATRDRVTQVADIARSHADDIDLVIISGDLVQLVDPSPDQLRTEYQFAAEAFAGIAPIAGCPGNVDQDGFDIFLDAIGATAHDWNSTITVDGIRVLLLDSHVPGKPYGHLDASALAWAKDLMADGRPTVLVMHHPAVSFNDEAIDAVLLDNGDELEALVAGAPNVLGILCSHLHAASATVLAGKPLVVSPGVFSYGLLPWDFGSGVRTDASSQPGFVVHQITETTLRSFPMLLRETGVKGAR